MPKKSIDILQQPLDQFPVTPELLAMAEFNDFHTLADVLKIPFHQFPSLPHASYRLLRELLTLLEEHQLSHLILDEGAVLHT